jgi:hypothetical protein
MQSVCGAKLPALPSSSYGQSSQLLAFTRLYSPMPIEAEAQPSPARGTLITSPDVLCRRSSTCKPRCFFPVALLLLFSPLVCSFPVILLALLHLTVGDTGRNTTQWHLRSSALTVRPSLSLGLVVDWARPTLCSSDLVEPMWLSMTWAARSREKEPLRG